MKKVIELLGVKKQVGDIGIEIECEGNGMIGMDEEVWRSEDDGSLRGQYPESRCEYILRKPIAIGVVHAALKQLSDRLKEVKAKLEFSYRCSVHVHVNVQQLEYQQLLAFMYIYYLLEEPFMTYCGKQRKGNNFCLRLSDAEGVLNVVQGLFSYGEEAIHGITHDAQRYAAMNFEALKKYGSLEFRGMEGNLDIERIDTWCKALILARDYAIKCDNPKTVYERYMALGPIDFIDEVLGGLSPEFHYLRIKKDVQKSFSISIDLPMSFMAFLKNLKDVKKREGFERFMLGDVVNHDTAVDIVNRGGKVKEAEGIRRYIVVEMPRKIKAPQYEVRIGHWGGEGAAGGYAPFVPQYANL